MEQRGNKTIMCSVFFLDIVEYSKKSVSGQIALRERFNAFLSKAVQNVPVNDRIILDTGDGAAISFIGDVEDALQVALAMRENLINEGTQMEPPLLVRMGINLGPVRLVKDINGQPNIVGDGINVAQRVMSFADADQLLVSRSYYDAVSRLSQEYAGMFHYQGSRTDKHVRDHEVYAIGYPGEFTATQERLRSEPQPPAGSSQDSMEERRGQTFMQRLHAYGQPLISAFRDAPPSMRAAYSGILAVSAIVIILLLAKLSGRDPATTHKAEESLPAQPHAAQPASGTVAATTVNPPVATTEKKQDATGKKPAVAGSKPDANANKTNPAAKKQDTAGKTPDAPGKKADAVASKPDTADNKPSVADSKPSVPDSKPDTGHKEPVATRKTPQDSAQKETTPAKADADHASKAFISVRCAEGSEIYLDGRPKGKISSTSSLVVEVEPGKHQITITRPMKSAVTTESASIKAGETVKIVPSLSDFCN